MEKSVYLRQDRLIDTFKLLDKDGNGKITAEELKEVLGSKYFIVGMYINCEIKRIHHCHMELNIMKK